MEHGGREGFFVVVAKYWQDVGQPILVSMLHWPMLFHVAIIVLAAWFAGSYKFNLPFIFLAGAYYLYEIEKRKNKRLRAQFRHEARKEAHRRRPMGDTETVRWMNDIIHKMWPICLERFASQELILPVAPWFLQKFKPWAVKQVHLQRLHLGSNPPYIATARVYGQTTGEDHVVMELAGEYVASDDMAAVLSATPRKRLGLGLSFNFHASNILMDFKVKVGVKFLPAWPYIGRLRVCFVEPPYVALAVKPLTKHAVNVSEMPIIAGFIDRMLNDALEKSLVEPNMLVIDVASLLGQYMSSVSGTFSMPREQAESVWVEEQPPVAFALVEILEGARLLARDLNGFSDPFVKGALGTSRFTSTCKPKTLDPKWFEDMPLLPISSWDLPNLLVLRVRDKDHLRTQDLGHCVVDLANFRGGQRHDVWLTLQGVKTGRLHVAVTINEDADPAMTKKGKTAASPKATSPARFGSEFGSPRTRSGRKATSPRSPTSARVGCDADSPLNPQRPDTDECGYSPVQQTESELLNPFLSDPKASGDVSARETPAASEVAKDKWAQGGGEICEGVGEEGEMEAEQDEDEESSEAEEEDGDFMGEVPLAKRKLNSSYSMKVEVQPGVQEIHQVDNQEVVSIPELFEDGSVVLVQPGKVGMQTWRGRMGGRKPEQKARAKYLEDGGIYEQAYGRAVGRVKNGKGLQHLGIDTGELGLSESKKMLQTLQQEDRDEQRSGRKSSAWFGWLHHGHHGPHHHHHHGKHGPSNRDSARTETSFQMTSDDRSLSLDTEQGLSAREESHAEPSSSQPSEGFEEGQHGIRPRGITLNELKMAKGEQCSEQLSASSTSEDVLESDAQGLTKEGRGKVEAGEDHDTVFVPPMRQRSQSVDLGALESREFEVDEGGGHKHGGPHRRRFKQQLVGALEKLTHAASSRFHHRHRHDREGHHDEGTDASEFEAYDGGTESSDISKQNSFKDDCRWRSNISGTPEGKERGSGTDQDEDSISGDNPVAWKAEDGSYSQRIDLRRPDRVATFAYGDRGPNLRARRSVTRAEGEDVKSEGSPSAATEPGDGKTVSIIL